jgi:hypothetical protein
MELLLQHGADPNAHACLYFNGVFITWTCQIWKNAKRISLSTWHESLNIHFCTIP